MHQRTEKSQQAKKHRASASLAQNAAGNKPAFQLKDNRPESVVQKKKAGGSSNNQAAPVQKKENKTGLPDNLKSGIENLSGHSMDDVKVHYNSDKPSRLNAHAYAQGTNIHLAPGQEKHLPHEAWHVVQQKQGRVKPTVEMKKVNVNDNKGLEKEADIMGVKAMQLKSGKKTGLLRQSPLPVRVAQAKFEYDGFDGGEKYNDIVNGLEGSENKYLYFLHSSPYGLGIIKLDKKTDKNPGDSYILIKKTKDGNWGYSDPEAFRKLDVIYGIGARIQVRKWYYDKYSSGKIMAMVAHEIGVHIVPYMDELMAKLPGAGKDVKVDNTKLPGPSGIKDHTRVANPKHEDFKLYRDVVKDLMDTLIKYNRKEAGEAKAGELADAYLMDLSTFTGTGKRVTTPYDANGIAKKYNSYREQTEFSKFVPPKTKRAVIKDYSVLYSRVLPVVLKQHPLGSTATAIAVIIVLCLLYFFISMLGKRIVSLM